MCTSAAALTLPAEQAVLIPPTAKPAQAPTAKMLPSCTLGSHSALTRGMSTHRRQGLVGDSEKNRDTCTRWQGRQGQQRVTDAPASPALLSQPWPTAGSQQAASVRTLCCASADSSAPMSAGSITLTVTPILGSTCRQCLHGSAELTSHTCNTAAAAAAAGAGRR